MKRNQATWIILLLSFALLFTTAQADGISLAPEDGTLAVFYVASTDDSVIYTSAQYVAQTIISRWPEKQLFISRTKTSNPKGYDKLETAVSKGVFDSGKLDGSETINANLQAIQGATSDIWIIVPENAASNLLANEGLKEQLVQLLDDGSSRAHVVFIGEGIDQNSISTSGLFSGGLSLDWIQIKRDFQTAQRSESEMEGIHTGDFLMASLFGQPLDLMFTAEEEISEPDYLGSFELPEDSRVLAVAACSGVEHATELVIRDEANNPVQAENLAVAKRKNGTAAYYGAYSENALNKGLYRVFGDPATAPSIKVYWYPSFETIQPMIETNDFWQLGNNPVRLSLQNMLGQAGQYTVQINIENKEAPVSLIYQEAENRWTKEYEVRAGETIAFTPRVSLYMEDGNQAWSWTGNPVTREIITGQVRLKPEAVKEVTLYYWDQQITAFTGSWDQYFQYNPLDIHEKGISLSEEAVQAGWVSESTEEGFSIRLNSETVQAEGMKQPTSFTATLSFGEKQHPITIVVKDAKQLFGDAISIRMPAERTFRVGQQIDIEASVSEIGEEWDAVKAQLEGETELPDITQLTLVVSIQSDEEKKADISKGEDITEIGDNQVRTATISLPLKKEWHSAKASITAEVRDAAGDVWKTAEIKDLQIENKKPIEKQDNQYAREIMMEGLPGQYQPVSLLGSVMGDQRLMDLFEDPEGALQSVSLTITPAENITLNEAPVMEQPIKIDGKSQPDIQVISPGDYLITMIATDGVNESEPVTITVSIKSSFMRLITIIGIALAAAILITVIVLIIIQKRKPSFGDVQIRCLLSEKPASGSEMLQKGRVIPMKSFQKKGVPFSTLMVLGRQPEASSTVTDILDDIMVYPYHYDNIKIMFGKKAMEKIGRQDNQEKVEPGNIIRFRIENTYFQIENYR